MMRNNLLFNLSVLLLCTSLLMFQTRAQSPTEEEEIAEQEEKEAKKAEEEAEGEEILAQEEEEEAKGKKKAAKKKEKEAQDEEMEAQDEEAAAQQEEAAAQDEELAAQEEEQEAKDEEEVAKGKEKAAKKKEKAAKKEEEEAQEEEEEAQEEEQVAKEKEKAAQDDEEAAEEDEEEAESEEGEECNPPDGGSEEEMVAAFMETAEASMRAALDACYQALWDDANGCTEETMALVKETGDAYDSLYAELRIELLGMLQTYPDYKDTALAFWVHAFLYASPGLLDETVKEFNKKRDQLVELIYQPILCPYGIEDAEQCNLTSVDFDCISQDTFKEYDEILYLWQTPVDTLAESDGKTLYTDTVTLWQTAAQVEEYPDAMSLDLEVVSLDPATGRDDMIALWDELKELYAELLYYMNSHMAKMHKDSFVIDEFGLAPMEFYATHPVYYGFMANKTNPYHESEGIQCLNELVLGQEITATQFAQYADELLVSMGFDPMTEDFWENSYFEYVEGKLCPQEDFVYRLDKDRVYVGQCLCPDIISAGIVYHHIAAVGQCMLMDQSEVATSFNFVDFTGWQNSIAESVSPMLFSPSYLAQLGVVSDDTVEESFLYLMFQEYTLMMPRMAYSMATQLWIWKVYNGETTPDTYNCDLYKLTAEYEGLRPPQPRDTDGFDAVTRERLIRSQGYVDWVFGYVAKYQIFKAMCDASGHEGPLYTCNLYDSKEAGEILKSLMTPGASVPYKDLFQEVLGASFDVTGIKEYFSPIIEKISAYNDEKDNRIPWTVEGAESVLCAPCSGMEEE